MLLHTVRSRIQTLASILNFHIILPRYKILIRYFHFPGDQCTTLLFLFSSIFGFYLQQIEGEDGGESTPSGGGGPAAAKGGGRKEKSVLQAKLTKLAIKIGYVGPFVSFNYSEFVIVIIRMSCDLFPVPVQFIMAARCTDYTSCDF